MGDVRGYFLWPSHGTTSATVTTNKNIKISSFKNVENTQKKEAGPDRSVANYQLFSTTLNEMAVKSW